MSRWALRIALLAEFAVGCGPDETSSNQAPPVSPIPAPAVDPVALEPPRPSAVHLGDSFTLGQFEYVITRTRPARQLGTRSQRQESSPGATFFLVDYTEKNIGRETVVGLSNNMRLLDQEGRSFSPSSRAMVALQMERGGELFLAELHPGLTRNATVAFEVPEEVSQQPLLKLDVGERGLLGSRRTEVLLASREHALLAKLAADVVGPLANGLWAGDTSQIRGLMPTSEAASFDSQRAANLLTDYRARFANTNDAFQLLPSPRVTDDQVTVVAEFSRTEGARTYAVARMEIVCREIGSRYHLLDVRFTDVER